MINMSELEDCLIGIVDKHVRKELALDRLKRKNSDERFRKEIKYIIKDIINKSSSNDIEIFDIKTLSDDEAKIMILNYIGEKITILELADNLHLDLDQTAVIFSRILKGD